jgi:hypothetical protein
MCSHCLFPVVVTSVEQVVSLCYKVDDGNRRATSCSNKTNTAVRNKLLYELVVINLLTTCYVQTISDLLEQLVAILLTSLTLLQNGNNLFHTCQQLGTSSANTSCWQAMRYYNFDQIIIFYPSGWQLPHLYNRSFANTPSPRWSVYHWTRTCLSITASCCL